MSSGHITSTYATYSITFDTMFERPKVKPRVQSINEVITNLVNTFNNHREESDLDLLLEQVDYPKPWPYYYKIGYIEYTNGKLIFHEYKESESKPDIVELGNEPGHRVQLTGSKGFESAPPSYIESASRTMGVYQQLAEKSSKPARTPTTASKKKTPSPQRKGGSWSTENAQSESASTILARMLYGRIGTQSKEKEFIDEAPPDTT